MSYSWLTDVNIILYYIGSLDVVTIVIKEAFIKFTNVVSVGNFLWFRPIIKMTPPISL